MKCHNWLRLIRIYPWIIWKMGGYLNKVVALPVCWERHYKWTSILTRRSIVETLMIHCRCKSHCVFQKNKDISPLFLILKVGKVFLVVLNVGTHFYFTRDNWGLEKGCGEWVTEGAKLRWYLHFRSASLNFVP